MTERLKIEGYKETQDMLKNIDKPVADKIRLAAGRAAARPLREKARSNLTAYSGQINNTEKLSKWIGIFKARDDKTSLEIGPNRARVRDFWFAHFIEYGYRDWETDRKSTRLNSSHSAKSRMPSSA